MTRGGGGSSKWSPFPLTFPPFLRFPTTVIANCNARNISPLFHPSSTNLYTLLQIVGGEMEKSESTLNNSLVFAVNGKKFDVSTIHPSTTLLEFLRSHTPFKGAKLSCGEGLLLSSPLYSEFYFFLFLFFLIYLLYFNVNIYVHFSPYPSLFLFG